MVIKFYPLILFTIFWNINSVFLQNEPTHPAEPAAPFEFQNTPARSLHGDFIQKAMSIILKKGVFQETPQLQRIPYLEPSALQKSFDFSLGEDGVNTDEMLKVIDKLFEISPRPAHKFRMGKRIAGLDPLALAGDWMAATMNNLIVTYLVSPVYTMMENKMTKYLSKKIGWTQPGDMVPTSGAGAANSMALAVAIQKFDRKTRDIGHIHITKNLKIFVSRHASISWKTAAIYVGIGTDNVVEIDVDMFGRMNPKALADRLDSELKETESQVMVVATAGTPIMGMIDNLDLIGSICQQRRIWFHVDAEKAGGYLFTPKRSLKSKLKGIHRADSVTVGMWLFAAPYTSTMIITKSRTHQGQRSALSDAFALKAPYVFTGIDTYNETYDRGDRTIQTSRRPEICKIWFAAARGEENSHLMFKNMEHVTTQFLRALESREGFQPVQAKSRCQMTYQLPLLSFYYVPVSLRGKEKDEDFNRQMTELVKTVKKKLQDEGLLELSVSYLPPPTTTISHAFFTVSLTNTRFTVKDIQFVLDEIENAAEGGKVDGSRKFPEQPPTEQTSVQFPNFPSDQIYGQFLKDILNIAFTEGIFFLRKDPTYNFRKPHELDRPDVFDFKLPSSPDHLLAQMLKAFKRLIHLSPHLAHPYFFYQLIAGVDPYTMIGDYISPVLNTPMLSYSDSAAFMLMEKEIVDQMIKRIYKTTDGDGIITDGGSMSNQIAIAMAKYHVLGDQFKTKGMKANNGKKFIVFMSNDAHYSVRKGAMLQGIGQNHTIDVEANLIGEMDVNKLEEAILEAQNNGSIPLIVVITTGTTIYGAIDSVEKIVALCEKYKIWTHVDGMFGGMLAMSDTHIQKFKGLERTDSWGADVHKMLGSTMVSTIMVTRHPGIMKKVFALDDMKQEELTEGDDRLNLMGRHAQMDKRNNILKFWLLWKAKGRKGIGAHIDKAMENKDFLISEIKRRRKEGFKLMIDNFDLTNVCFQFMTPNLDPDITAGLDITGDPWILAMRNLTFAIEKKFVENGIISFVTQKRRISVDRVNPKNNKYTPVFIKFVMMGSMLTHEDIKFLLDSVAYIGGKIKINPIRSSDEETDETSDRDRFDPFGNLPPYVKFD